MLERLRHRSPRPFVVVMTGFGSVESAVECMRHGTFDCLIKPFSADQIEGALTRADQHLEIRKLDARPSPEDPGEEAEEILGRSPAMEQLRQRIRRVAPTQATVLIEGESGTGKELVARAIYKQSPRANAPFIRVNCAAVPDTLIESEFFGHEKGAFTGALSKRQGRFELAHGGTILLDEISEISPAVQAKLLRVLQERELERVGGNRTIQVDVRVIATTNRRLEQSVERKEFREDLYFRLNVVPIHVPPLRERMEDVVLLAEELLRRFTRKHGKRDCTLSPDSLAALCAHAWPGNVRELENVIERAVILCGEGALDAEHLDLPQGTVAADALTTGTLRYPGAEAAVVVAPTATPVPAASATNDDILPLDELERRHLLMVLDRCGGNRTHAAKLLGISVRTMRNKLHEYHLNGLDDAERTSAAPPQPVADSLPPSAPRAPSLRTRARSFPRCPSASRP